MTTSEKNLRIAPPPTAPLDAYIAPDPYALWKEREGVPVIVDYAFEDLNAIELGPWPRKGGRGAIINIPNNFLRTDSHVVEIRPGGKSEPERHLYEEVVYVISGRGATSVWLDEKEKQTFEWHEGSLFAIPLNACYQHFNGGAEPCRYLAVTNAPPMMRLFRDIDFIFNTPYLFRSRFKEASYGGSGKLYQKRVWESNFIPNAPDMGLYVDKARGTGINVQLKMVQNNLNTHISEFPVGTYKKAHRHGPGAHLLILSGVGYSMLWVEGHEYRKADWKRGGMVIVPDDQCFHQHFNTGTVRARYLALRGGDQGFYPPMSAGGESAASTSLTEGGWQIEYPDEDRRIHEIFEKELTRNGAPCLMKAFSPWCTGEAGPTQARDT